MVMMARNWPVKAVFMIIWGQVAKCQQRGKGMIRKSRHR